MLENNGVSGRALRSFVAPVLTHNKHKRKVICDVKGHLSHLVSVTQTHPQLARGGACYESCG